MEEKINYYLISESRLKELNGFWRNTKEVIDNKLYRLRSTTTGKKLIDDMEMAKIAIFPASKLQEVEQLKNFSKLGFRIIILSCKDYRRIKANYESKLVTVSTDTTDRQEMTEAIDFALKLKKQQCLF